MGLQNRNGVWHWRLWVRGREVTGTTGLGATKRNETAAKKMMEAERERLRERPEGAREIAFLEAAALFLDWCRNVEYRAKPNTYHRIKTSFASLEEHFRDRLVSAITPGDVEQYKEWRIKEHGIKDVTLRHDLHALSLFFNKYALKHRWVRENPVDEVTKPSDADAIRIHVLSAEEEEKYFEEAARRKPTLYDVARLLLLQGCRPEEIMALRQADVDQAGAQIKIRGGKSAAARRTLDLTGESMRILEGRLDGGEFVFPSPRYPGRHITKLNNQHDEVCREAGVSFCLYDLRHTFATRMAASGCPLPTLAAILGHSGLRMVMRYVHPTADDKKAAMRRYEAGLRPGLRLVEAEKRERTVAKTVA
jgi:integrase